MMKLCSTGDMKRDVKNGRMHKPLKLVAHCDASYTINLKDGSSQGGMIIFLVDSEGRASPISWTAKNHNSMD